MMAKNKLLDIDEIFKDIVFDEPDPKIHGNKGKPAWNKGKTGVQQAWNKGVKTGPTGKPGPNKGKPSPKKGTTVTTEQKQKQSSSMSGRKWWHRKDESRLCKEKPGPDWSPGRFYK
jgi:hypothetical protein